MLEMGLQKEGNDICCLDEVGESASLDLEAGVADAGTRVDVEKPMPARNERRGGTLQMNRSGMPTKFVRHRYHGP